MNCLRKRSNKILVTKKGVHSIFPFSFSCLVLYLIYYFVLYFFWYIYILNYMIYWMSNMMTTSDWRSVKHKFDIESKVVASQTSTCICVHPNGKKKKKRFTILDKLLYLNYIIKLFYLQVTTHSQVVDIYHYLVSAHKTNFNPFQCFKRSKFHGPTMQY